MNSMVTQSFYNKACIFSLLLGVLALSALASENEISLISEAPFLSDGDDVFLESQLSCGL